MYVQFTLQIEPEYGTAGKLLLLACEDGVLRGCDVRNKEIVSKLKSFAYSIIIFVCIGSNM